MCAPGSPAGHNPKTGFCWDSRGRNGFHCGRCCETSFTSQPESDDQDSD